MEVIATFLSPDNMSVSTLTITFGGQLGVASQWPAALEAILMDGPWGISIACSVEVVQLWIDTYIAQRERERESITQALSPP